MNFYFIDEFILSFSKMIGICGFAQIIFLNTNIRKEHTQEIHIRKELISIHKV